MLSSFFQRIQAYPGNLFLMDALGALLSAFLLRVVLVRLESLFGIPVPTLYFLASFPVAFAFFDGIVFLSKAAPVARYLKWLALFNLLYCLLSLTTAFYHSISVLGWIYILVEVSIVASIAALELRVANLLGK